MGKATRIWHDGTIIRSARIVDLYDSALLLERKQFASGQHRWIAKCEYPQCVDGYDVYYSKKRKCIRHSRKNLISGEGTQIEFPARYAHKIIWKFKKRKSGKIQKIPYAPCEVGSCLSYTEVARNRGRPILACSKCRNYWNEKRPFETRFNALVKSVARRNQDRARAGSKKISFTLCYSSYAKHCRDNPDCVYCGVKTFDSGEAARKCRQRKGSVASGLDRKDNEKGYTLANVVTCCGLCNRKKGAFLSYSEMKILGLAHRGAKQKLALFVKFAAKTLKQDLKQQRRVYRHLVARLQQRFGKQ